MDGNVIRSKFPMHEGAPAPERQPAASTYLWCHHDVDYPRWETYLKAFGHNVVRHDEIANKRNSIEEFANAETVVVTSDWYNSPQANLLMFVARYLESQVLVAYDANVAGAVDAAQGLVPIPAATLNPVALGQVERGIDG